MSPYSWEFRHRKPPRNFEIWRITRTFCGHMIWISYDTSQLSHPPFHIQRRDHLWISIPSWIIRCRQPGHSFRPYTEKELPFPVPNEKCFYTPNSDLMSLYCILFQCISNGSYTNPIIDRFESFWPWSSNAMYVLRPSQGNTILRDTKIQSTTMINNFPVQNVTSNLIGRINT